MCKLDSKENTRVFFFFKRENTSLKLDKIDVKFIRVFVFKYNCNRREVLKGFWRSANSPTLSRDTQWTLFILAHLDRVGSENFSVV